MIRTFRAALAAGVAVGAILGGGAQAQTAPVATAAAADTADASDVVVTGTRERGAVLSDIPPELQLDRRDIRATGAGSVSELIAILTPQTSSTRGRGGGDGPVILLDGRRISSFSEVRDLPPEVMQKPRARAGDDTLDLQAQERVSIERALERFGGNRKKAAEALNISTVTLWRRMKQYGLES